MWLLSRSISGGYCTLSGFAAILGQEGQSGPAKGDGANVENVRHGGKKLHPEFASKSALSALAR